MTKLSAIAAFCAVIGMSWATSAERAFAEPATAVLAGGCFWSLEADLDKVPGVIATTSGYSSGTAIASDDASSEDAAIRREAVRVEYDPAVLNYERLLDIFWHSIDPTDAEGQSCDRGRAYSTAIYAASVEEQRIAEATRARIDSSGALAAPVVTPILTAPEFSAASAANQNFYVNQPSRYARNRVTCRRDAIIRKVWGKEAFAGITRRM